MFIIYKIYPVLNRLWFCDSQLLVFWYSGTCDCLLAEYQKIANCKLCSHNITLGQNETQQSRETTQNVILMMNALIPIDDSASNIMKFSFLP